MSPAPDIPPSIPDTLVAELPCRSCGYLLRGLSPHDDCPECGRSVASSLSRELSYANPQWLDALTRGARYCELSVPLNIVHWVGALFGYVALDEALSPAALLLALLLISAGPLASVMGAWYLATPEPGISPPENRAARYWIRGMSLLSLITFIPIPMALLSSSGAVESVNFYYVCFLASWLFRNLTFIGELILLDSLYRRMPRTISTARIRSLRFWLIFNLLALSVPIIIFALGQSTVGGIAGYAWILTGLGWLFSVMVFLTNTTRRLRSNLDLARRRQVRSTSRVHAL